MKKIRYTNTLVYYDGIQVFEAMDAIGGRYIALLTDIPGDEDTYRIAGVSPECLRRFRAGVLDLRTLLLDREEEEWFLGKLPDAEGVCIALESHSESLEDTPFLPDSGFLVA